MLFSRRKRQEVLAEREAAGESFWTSSFSTEVRSRMLYAAADAAGQSWGGVRGFAYGLLVRAYGRSSLASRSTRDEDFFGWAAQCSDDLFPDVVESLDAAMVRQYADEIGLPLPRPLRDVFRELISDILREERVAFDFIDGKMHSFQSRELFAGVVSPALTLLAGAPAFAAAEAAYQNALRELAEGHPEDAITDATTALGEALKAFGCTENKLAQQARCAHAKGLLTAYDVKLFNWAQADRFNLGDAHQGVTSTTPGDAWLVVHVVGAIIVRLTEGPRS